jgi:hypothetical protein
MNDAPLHALDAPSPAGLSNEEKLVWILGDLMNAVENHFGAENPKRRGHINSAAIRIIDEVLTPARAQGMREAAAIMCEHNHFELAQDAILARAQELDPPPQKELRGQSFEKPYSKEPKL